MTDETRNDAIDRLGGKSRLAQLEELVEELRTRVNELEDDVALVPGAKIVGPLVRSWLRADGIWEQTMSGTYELLAVGRTYAVLRDVITDDLFFRQNHAIRDELRDAHEFDRP